MCKGMVMGTDPASDFGGLTARMHVVRDDPARMQKMLAMLYADVSGVLAKQAPHGVIPLDRITVETLPWRGVHARTSEVGGRTVIKISLGLVNLLYLMIRGFASRAVIQGKEGTATTDMTSQLAIVLDRAAAPMLPIAMPGGLGQEQIQIAELHTQWGEWFLLAHELAHAHKIDATALATMPLLARFSGEEQRRAGLEHAADLFGVWLLCRMAELRIRRYLNQKGSGPESGAQTNDREMVLKNKNLAYAGAELTLQTMNMLEDFDPDARPTQHPSAHDRILFLRDAMIAGQDRAVLADALQWSRLLAANVPQAIATAMVNRDVAERELAAVLDRAESGTEPGWLDDRDHILTFLLGSRSGSMRMLLRILTSSLSTSAPKQQEALALAEKYLPRGEPAYAPFWASLQSDEGGWTV